MTLEGKGISTRAIHGGERPVAPGVPVVDADRHLDDLRLRGRGRVRAGDERGGVRLRLLPHPQPDVEELNGALAELEGAEEALAFSSGMAAITAALLTRSQPGDTLLCASQLYGTPTRSASAT